MKNGHVLTWLKQHELDEAFVYDHSGKLADWTAVMEKCDNCKGLDFCRQPKRGERIDLYLDGMLMNQVSHCTYYKEQQQAYAHRRFYKQMDMLEHYLLVDIKAIDLKSESPEYKAAYQKIVKVLKDKNQTKGVYLWGSQELGKAGWQQLCATIMHKKKKALRLSMSRS